MDFLLQGLKLNQIVYTNAFIDPFIGIGNGFAENTRVVGNVSLVITPSNPASRLEAWRPILEDCDFTGTLNEWTVRFDLLECCSTMHEHAHFTA